MSEIKQQKNNKAIIFLEYDNLGLYVAHDDNGYFLTGEKAESLNIGKKRKGYSNIINEIEIVLLEKYKNFEKGKLKVKTRLSRLK